MLSQTLVRFAGVGHGPANAAMLPHTLPALARRGAERADGARRPRRPARRRAEAVRAARPRVTEQQLDACADAAAERAELDRTPPRATRDELRALYADAY